MSTGSFPTLASAWISAHAADQVLLALLPLLLTVSGADATTVSLVVAAHSAAWLIVSLPVGAYADALPRRQIMRAGAIAIIAGATTGAGAMAMGGASAAVLGLVSFLVAAGVVMIVLSAFALLPRFIARPDLARSNAVLEFGRALTCVIAPLVVAYLVARGASVVAFGLALLGGIAALLATAQLPAEPPATSAALPMMQAIREGAAFVAREPLLRAIALCAIAWNSAFFALTAVFAPYAMKDLGMSVEEVGSAWSIYGAGLVLGALAAPIMIARLPTGWMFAFGPAMSGLGIALMVALARPGVVWPIWIGFFSLGFGPMTWLVLQTSVRQIVTPNALLGRVGAVITTAIYGVRPLGALLAATVAAQFGSGGALWLAAGLFLISMLAILVSPAVRLSAMPKPAGV